MERMSEDAERDRRRPRRVTVLMDASPDALNALEVAAELAARHRAPLLGISVEEPERTRGQAFAFASEVGAVSGAVRRLEPGSIARQRRRGPSLVRNALERAARAAGVDWQLLTARGQVVEAVLELSEPGDLLLLGRVGWSTRVGRRLGSTPLRLARRSPATVYICSATRLRERGCTAVLLEETVSAPRLVALAGERAASVGRPLIALVAPSVASSNAGSEQRFETIGMRVRQCPLPAVNTAELLRALAEEGAVELVVARHGRWLQTTSAERLLRHWRMPLLVTPRPSD